MLVDSVAVLITVIAGRQLCIEAASASSFQSDVFKVCKPHNP